MQEILFVIADYGTRIILSPYFWTVVAVTVSFLVIRVLYRKAKLNSLGHLEYTRSFSSDGVFAEDSLTFTEVIRNPTFFPLFSVKMEFFIPSGFVIDGMECDGHTKMTSLFHIPPRATVTKTHSVRADLRGRYHLETSMVRYAKNDFLFSVPFDICVYPNYSAVKANIDTYLYRVGDSISKNKCIEDPFFISGIRRYQVGDPMRNINFKASVRSFSGGMRQMMTNSYDSSRNFDAMIFLDLFNYSQNGDAERQKEQLELGLCYACYILSAVVDHGGSCGFASNCAPAGRAYMHIPCSSGNLHTKRMLEAFASVNYYDKRDHSINSLLENIVKELAAGVDVYLITPVIDSKTALTIRRIEGMGRNVCVIPLSERGCGYEEIS